MDGRHISHFITMGDSLSDCGTLDHKKLFGLIPFSTLSGLAGRSPKGRFTNGFVWVDHLSAILANHFIINFLEKSGKSLEDIADGIITHDEGEEKLLKHDYNLDKSWYVLFNGHDFIRSYDEGGLTAHNYSHTPCLSPTLFATRLIVETLGSMRAKLVKDDEEKKRSTEHKANALIIEWSGANDLVTVNSEPSEQEVIDAIAARVKNIEELIKHGYQHFILINLPNIALTPRYQVKSEKEKQEMHDICELFNKNLNEACRKLHREHPHCFIDVFDVSKQFNEIYQHPEKYHLDKEKLTQPFTTSKDFKTPGPDGISVASGYMFWDEIHPTADVHALIAEIFYEHYRHQFIFEAPDIKKKVSSLTA